MRNRIVLGCAVAFLSTAGCTAATFVGNDASDDAGQGDSAVHPNSGGNDDAGGDASVTVDAAPPPGCDGTKLPSDDTCVVNDADGVFVSSSLGTAAGNGTQAKPFASLNAAIAAAKAAKRRVYACAESYAEHVDFLDGVSVFGYFACDSSWAVVQSAHAKVVAPTSPAATAANITTPTRIEAVDLVAPDYATGSQSSIALLATGSPALTYTKSTIHAGTGGKGDDGTDAIQLTDSAYKSGTNGSPSVVCTGTSCFSFGAPGATNTCSGEPGHVPGAGGDGGNPGTYKPMFFVNGYVWNAVSATTAGSPTAPTPATAQGGGFGLPGSDGAPGADGQAGHAGHGFGSLSAAGYAPSDGTAGADGDPGQGGGGAGSYDDLSSRWPAGNYANSPNALGIGAAGGGGGAGGCPGLAATPGKGGGASIAIVSIGSPFTLDTMILQASSGGSGGAAGSQSTPTTGGAGGAAAIDVSTGGHGGAGGRAGVSGNGGGGPSFGLAYQGTAPTSLGSQITVGAGGSGVAARVGKDGVTIPASADGMSAMTYAF